MEILYTKDGTPRYVVKSYSSDELTEEIKELIANGTIGNRHTLQKVIELWVQK